MLAASKEEGWVLSEWHEGSELLRETLCQDALSQKPQVGLGEGRWEEEGGETR